MTAYLTPPGWYPDPDVPGGHRFWDGTAWTEHRQAAPETPEALKPETPAAARKRRRLFMVVIPLATVIIGTFIVISYVGKPRPTLEQLKQGAQNQCEQVIDLTPLRNIAFNDVGTEGLGNNTFVVAGSVSGTYTRADGTDQPWSKVPFSCIERWTTTSWEQVSINFGQ